MKNKINFTQIKKLVIKFLDQLFRWLGTDSLLENTKKRIIKFLPTNKIKVQWPKLVILFLFSLVLISLGTFFYQSFCDDVWQGTSLTANIVKYIKNKDVKRLLDLQKMMIEEWGNEECMLHSDLEKFNKKEPIKFPFEVLK